MRVSLITWATAAVFVGAFHCAVQAHVERIDRYTARQCLQEDWPLAQAPVHREWCAHNGYPLP